MASRLYRSSNRCRFIQSWTRPATLILIALLLVLPSLVTYIHQQSEGSGRFSGEGPLPKQAGSDGVRSRPGKIYHPRTKKNLYSDIATTGVVGDAADEPLLKMKGNPVAITDDNNVSRIITAFKLRNQLPNYFTRGDPAGLAERYREGKMAFVQNVKSGGTTIKNCIVEMCRDLHIPTSYIDNRNRMETFTKYEIEAGTPNRTIFRGQGSYTICEYVRDRPCSYFTMVREPVSRLVSSYLFCQQSGTDCTKSSVNVSLDAWALNWGSMLFHTIFWHFQKHFPFKGADNCFQHQSAEFRVFAKELQHKYPSIVTGNRLGYRMTYRERQAFLSYCLENLENRFAVIGLIEEFNTSVDLYQEVYRLPFRDYLHGAKNIGRAKQEMDPSKINKMKEEIRANPFIMEALYEDIKIYEKAQEIMKLQKQAFGLV
ncbi:uncharacterized protein LOC100888079 [Strongylocentrotus purpuratus]|uniref:Uncharacterized protein n=1 Tax=Strongylocentrotus purpuratus TaxID=7668 RepID=A0A7M7GHX3_STRPU|nr:uncharacterized protein LOC100888079 [Strongylocentrotus purpuratus]